MTISVTGFFKSSMVGVDRDWRGAGMFSLFSGVNSSFLAGESLKLRFSRFEAACARMLVLCHCWSKFSEWMMQVASVPVSRE